MERERDPIDDTLALAAAVPGALVAAVFRRYGKPLADPLPPPTRDDRSVTLILDEGPATLRPLQVRTPVDVIANDWFVLDAPGSEATAVPAPLFSSALAALARAIGR
jgi:hypothetical protein